VADEHNIRRATTADAPEIGRLLYDFNTEFDEAVPDSPVIAERLAGLLERGEVTVLLGGDGPDGIAVLRFRPALYIEGPEAYLQELYVAPEKRGGGLGRALLEEAIAVAKREGAAGIELGTEEGDTAARALYESAGFSNRGNPAGEVSYFYELDF
jgi:ribosomal protein S18 acetylase RimI-like enzyme